MKLAICGFGRAARPLAKNILDTDTHTLQAVLCRASSTKQGMDIGDILYGKGKSVGIAITSPEKILEAREDYDIDVVIDFSHHDMAFPLIALCGNLGANLVICTTNHSIEEISKFQEFSEKLNLGVVYAPNLTIGINLLMDFVKRLAKISPDFSFEIVERHPKDKAPVTTTARMISQAIDREDVPIHSVRLNGYVGVHEVTASNGYEKITIEHESFSRMAFANGALLAAGYIQNRKGFYLMRDVVKDIISDK